MAFRIVPLGELQMGLGVRIDVEEEDQLVPVVVQAGFFQMVDRIDDFEVQDLVVQVDPDKVHHKVAAEVHMVQAGYFRMEGRIDLEAQYQVVQLDLAVVVGLEP